MYARLIAVATIGSILLIVLDSAWTGAFHLRTKHEEKLWNSYIAPVLSTIVFSVILWLAVMDLELLAGAVPAAQWLWVLVPLAGLVGLAVGSLEYSAPLHSTRPGDGENDAWMCDLRSP